MRKLIHGLTGCLFAAMMASQANAATTGNIQYVFSSDAYEAAEDHHMTATRYTTDMSLEVAVTLDAPLAGGLSFDPIDARQWRFDDGIYTGSSSDMGRFNGFVSTAADGSITDFLIQLYLDASNSPGVWLRRFGSETAYATTMSQEVQTGATDPCWRHRPSCAADPITTWVEDRAMGNGAIAVSIFSQGSSVQSTALTFNATASVPLPAPLLFLTAGLLALRLVKRQA